jgi:hypothetical protein
MTMVPTPQPMSLSANATPAGAIAKIVAATTIRIALIYPPVVLAVELNGYTETPAHSLGLEETVAIDVRVVPLFLCLLRNSKWLRCVIEYEGEKGGEPYRAQSFNVPGSRSTPLIAGVSKHDLISISRSKQPSHLNVLWRAPNGRSHTRHRL